MTLIQDELDALWKKLIQVYPLATSIRIEMDSRGRSVSISFYALPTLTNYE